MLENYFFQSTISSTVICALNFGCQAQERTGGGGPAVARIFVHPSNRREVNGHPLRHFVRKHVFLMQCDATSGLPKRSLEASNRWKGRLKPLFLKSFFPGKALQERPFQEKRGASSQGSSVHSSSLRGKVLSQRCLGWSRSESEVGRLREQPKVADQTQNEDCS